MSEVNLHDGETDKLVERGTPADFITDISDTRGFSYVLFDATSKDLAGMLVRRLMISGDGGQIADVQITLTDLIWLSTALIDSIALDVSTIEKIPGFSLRASARSKDGVLNDIRKSAEQLSKAAEALEGIPFFLPRHLEADADK